MGNRNSGPRPRPTAIKLLRGVTRRDRLNTSEPKPPIASEEFDNPPPELDGDTIAIGEWRRVVPMLRRISLITEADRAVLIALCKEWSIYITASREMATQGMVIETERGPVASPYSAIANKAFANCRSMWVELGLTPSGRAKLHAAPPDDTPESKWAGLLS